MSNICKFTAEDIAAILKSYKGLMLKVKQLEYEIENYSPITGLDIIDSATFGNSLQNRSGNSCSRNASDKVADIAITYEEKADMLNFKQKQELEIELHAIRKEIQRIEFYMTLLDDRYTMILRSLYFDGLTYAETAKSAGVTNETVRNYRIAGLNDLARLYNNMVK